MTTSKPHDPTLRAAIIAEMKRMFSEGMKRYSDLEDRAWLISTWGYCTWWFKFELQKETKDIRREMERMERDGLVVADRKQSNNTKWKLAEVLNDNQ